MHYVMHHAMHHVMHHAMHRVKVGRAALPPGLAAAVATWDSLNPEYEHAYYDEAAMAQYVAARAPLFAGIRQAYDKATSGAMRCATSSTTATTTKYY